MDIRTLEDLRLYLHYVYDKKSIEKYGKYKLFISQNSWSPSKNNYIFSLLTTEPKAYAILKGSKLSIINRFINRCPSYDIDFTRYDHGFNMDGLIQQAIDSGNDYIVLMKPDPIMELL